MTLPKGWLRARWCKAPSFLSRCESGRIVAIVAEQDGFMEKCDPLFWIPHSRARTHKPARGLHCGGRGGCSSHLSRHRGTPRFLGRTSVAYSHPALFRRHGRRNPEGRRPTFFLARANGAKGPMEPSAFFCRVGWQRWQRVPRCRSIEKPRVKPVEPRLSTLAWRQVTGRFQPRPARPHDCFLVELRQFRGSFWHGAVLDLCNLSDLGRMGETGKLSWLRPCRPSM